MSKTETDEELRQWLLNAKYYGQPPKRWVAEERRDSGLPSSKWIVIMYRITFFLVLWYAVSGLFSPLIWIARYSRL